MSQQQASKATNQGSQGGDLGKELLTGGKGGRNPGKSKKKKQQSQPRAMGSVKQELINRPFKDIVSGLGELIKAFSPSEILQIDSNNDTPEEIARKKKMHARWQKLTQAEQKVAKEKSQKRLQKKQREEQEKQRKKQLKEQQKQQSIAPPSSPQKGPSLVGKGQKKSSKNLAMGQMQRSRQGLGGPGSVN